MLCHSVSFTGQKRIPNRDSGALLTICLYHGLPVSPSRLVNARSAIINRSLISRTFSVYCLVLRLQFSACSNYITEMRCSSFNLKVIHLSVRHVMYYLLLFVNFSGSTLELLDGLLQRRETDRKSFTFIYDIFCALLHSTR